MAQNHTIKAEIKRLEELLGELDVVSEEYEKTVQYIERLKKLNRPRSFQVSGDAILTASVSIIGMLLIMNYEKDDAITTKAFGWVPKPKL